MLVRSESRTHDLPRLSPVHSQISHRNALSGISRKNSNQSHPFLLSSCLPSTLSLKGNHNIQSTNRKTSFLKLKIARAHSSPLHGQKSGAPRKDSLICHSAEKTKQCFFFALRYLIGLASVVFKPSSTKTATELRDKGNTILFFNNFNSNLTKSLYKAKKM